MAQGNLVLPTTGVFSGLTQQGYINNAMAALVSQNSGSSAPTNGPSGAPVLGQTWIDTANGNLLKIYDGSSTWLTLGKVDATGHIWHGAIGGGSTTLASAGTADLGSKTEAYISITGTTTITSFGSSVPAGTAKLLSFAAALTLTYNATSMILPSAASITTAAGDTALVASLGSGNWKVIDYTRADGTSLKEPTIATDRIMGNNSGSTAAPSALTPTQITAMLDQATPSVKGLMPAYPNNTTTYLRGDNTFASSASLGGRVLLNTLTASASSDLSDTISFTSSYKFYQIEIISLVPTTNATEIQLQIHSGGSFKTSGYIGVTSGVLSAPGGLVARNVSTFVPLSGALNDTANSAPGVSGTLRFADPSASAKCVVIGQIMQKYSASNNFYNLQTVGYWDTAAVVTGFKLIATSGTLASGVAYVYGYN